MLKTAIPTSLWQLSAPTGGSEQLGHMAASPDTVWGSKKPSVSCHPEPGLASASQQEGADGSLSSHSPTVCHSLHGVHPAPLEPSELEDSLHRWSPTGPIQGHILPAPLAETLQMEPRASRPAPGWTVLPQQPWPTLTSSSCSF